MRKNTVILGAGYTGRYLADLLERQGRPYYAGSRQPDKRLGHLPAERRIRFDLGRPESWRHLPEGDLLWCFPAAPPDSVKDFAVTLAPSRRLVVLGSTSAYDLGESVAYPPPWIDETAPIDRTRPRVQGEEFLRTTYGAIVLRVAGIYGPGRSPLHWVKSGLVAPSRKYVNLIHVEDLASICLTALERGRPGEVYNVSDGTPRTWEDICGRIADRWNISSSSETLKQEPGKRIDIRKLREELQPRFRHPELFAALEALAGL